MALPLGGELRLQFFNLGLHGVSRPTGLCGARSVDHCNRFCDPRLTRHLFCVRLYGASTLDSSSLLTRDFRSMVAVAKRHARQDKNDTDLRGGKRPEKWKDRWHG
jgi:hypothetical protein